MRTADDYQAEARAFASFRPERERVRPNATQPYALEIAVNQAIAACDGDLRSTVRALIMANNLLEEELGHVIDFYWFERLHPRKASYPRPAMRDAVFWWFQYLRIFALNAPWGTASKFTIGVDAYTGERIAEMFNLTPTEVVDAYGRPCLQVEPEERLIAIEWFKPEPVVGSSSPVTWGGKSSADADPRSRYQRTPTGGLELKKPAR